MQKYKMKEIGNIISGGTPSTNNPFYWDGEIPWITPKDLSKSTYLKKYSLRYEKYIDKKKPGIHDPMEYVAGKFILAVDSCRKSCRKR